jgi:hypothetical protein
LCYFPIEIINCPHLVIADILFTDLLRKGEMVMAQSLEKTFSPGRCVRFSKRFIRLCTQVNGTQVLIPDVQNAINDVQQKESMYNASDENVDYAFDITKQKDNDLDDKIRDTAEDCKKIDRKDLQSQTYSLIFPQNISSIINNNDRLQLTDTNKLIARIRNLGPDHPLQQNAVELQQLVDESEEAQKNLAEAKKIRDSCKTDLDVAKLKLVQTYNNTILKSKQLFGNKITDKIFPIINPKKGNTTKEEAAQTEETVPAN